MVSFLTDNAFRIYILSDYATKLSGNSCEKLSFQMWSVRPYNFKSQSFLKSYSPNTKEMDRWTDTWLMPKHVFLDNVGDKNAISSINLFLVISFKKVSTCMSISCQCYEIHYWYNQHANINPYYHAMSSFLKKSANLPSMYKINLTHLQQKTASLFVVKVRHMFES